MSSLKTDAIEAATGTNTNLALTGKGTGKVALGDAALLVPDADGAAGQILTTDGSLALTFAATPGSSGNVLTSNGSAWTSAAAAGGGAWNYISTVTASASATVEFTSGFDTTYDQYAILITSVVPVNDSVNLSVRVSTNSGSSFETSGYWYFTSRSNSAASTPSGANGANVGFIELISFIGNASGEAGFGCVYLNEPTNTSLFTYLNWRGGCVDNGGAAEEGAGAGHWGTTTAVNALQFYFSAGNIASGVFRLYGIADS